MTDTQRKWGAWIIGAIAFLYFGKAAHHATAKDLAQEASGQQVIPLDASNEEKQGVALIAEEIQAFKTFQLRKDALEKKSTLTNINKPASMASPVIAAETLDDVAEYCEARQQEKSTLASVFARINVNQPVYLTDYFVASHNWCVAETNLYTFAKDPALNIHIDPADGKLIFPKAAPLNTYHVRLAAVYDARDKFLVAEKTLLAESDKEQKSDGVTNKDYGLPGKQ
jgi:hypothetical protein